ncbi:ribosomal RNA small subunit methyltransferase A [Patescibacteria group bacterium]|nr:ribosomal RNA small subunit methyltransferase A [Patescibacteria group bacterium]MBU1964143.1 ribosomal RNA small subunit methyltransferase A [Patescibacteria group bacterium]
MNKSELLSLLKQYNVQPSREKGQNFLINDEVIHQMISTANLEKNDTVLEIGAGFGNLTAELAKNVQKVIAIEPDNDVFPALKKLAKTNTNLELINDDVFSADLRGKIEKGEYKIVANLPYQVTSSVFRYFLEQGPQPKSMTVMVQKEVAERICAKVGQKSKLSLSIDLYCDPEIAFYVPKTDFCPAPKVDSAVINLPNISLKYKVNEKEFFRIIRIGFSSKRKKLLNNLENGLKLGKNQLKSIFKDLEINENARPQEIHIKTWVSLFDAISQI